MSVIVKGMKMPKDGCKDCIFVNRKWHGDVCQLLKKEVTGNVERGGFQTSCPLVPVPPHGKLIDADVLCKILRSLAENEYTPEVFANWVENHIDAIIPAEPCKEKGE